MATKNWSYIGKGSIYLAPTASPKALRPIGNASALTLEVEEEEQRQKDYTSAGGGTANVVKRIDSVSASMTMLELSPENIAQAVRGNTTEQSSESVTAESHTVSPGQFVLFDKVPDTSASMTITGSDTSTDLVEGEDYILGQAGIYITDNPTNVSDGDTIEIDYESLLHDVVEALTEAGAEYRMVFDGLNEAASGRAVNVELHRVAFSPTEELSLIGDEFGELSVSGEVLRDSDKATSTTSGFFRVRMAH